MAKSSKSERSDRQKLIDEIRSKQSSADKRQGFLIVGVSILIAVLLIGAVAWGPLVTHFKRIGDNDKTLDELGAAADVCGEITTKPAEGNASHVEGQVIYTDAPPAFGNHWSQAGSQPAPVSIDDRFYTDNNRPEVEQLVHNIEHGFTILWYDETAASDTTMMATIKSIADRLNDSDSNQRFAFKAVPWTEEDAEEVAEGTKDTTKLSGNFPDGQHIAMTAWTTDDAGAQQGVWQYCSEPSGEALVEFMKTYPYIKAPEPIGGMGTS